MPALDERAEAAAATMGRSPARRIVAKVGTNVLTAGSERLDLEVMAGLVGQIARLRQAGYEVVLVSSGAIAAGRWTLAQTRRRGDTETRGRGDAETRRHGDGETGRRGDGETPEDRDARTPKPDVSPCPRVSVSPRLGVPGGDVPFKQVLAALGQSRLMQAYDQLFSWHGLPVAQTLLTRADLADRQGYFNARNTLLALLELGAVPIVNENDVVATEEIRVGDNDNLSALVAGLVDADLLVMLTDTAGLFDADPRRAPEARLIPRVDRIDASVEALARGAGTERGTGGMLTKIQAARIATMSGVTVVIAAGREPNVLGRLAAGEALGTLFPPAASRLESRKRWITSGLTGRGRIVVDAGAVRALRDQGKSLLSAGIVGVQGRFERGDTVAIVDAAGHQVACGVTNYAAADVGQIKGARSDSIERLLGFDHGAEVVHRNNLVVV